MSVETIKANDIYHARGKKFLNYDEALQYDYRLETLTNYLEKHAISWWTDESDDGLCKYYSWGYYYRYLIKVDETVLELEELLGSLRSRILPEYLGKIVFLEISEFRYGGDYAVHGTLDQFIHDFETDLERLKSYKDKAEKGEE